MQAERHTLPVEHFADGAQFRDFFNAVDGPTIAAYRNIGGDVDRTAALDADIARIGDGFLSDGSTMNWEYLRSPRTRPDTMAACPMTRTPCPP